MIIKKKFFIVLATTIFTHSSFAMDIKDLDLPYDQTKILNMRVKVKSSSSAFSCSTRKKIIACAAIGGVVGGSVVAGTVLYNRHNSHHGSVGNAPDDFFRNGTPAYLVGRGELISSSTGSPSLPPSLPPSFPPTIHSMRASMLEKTDPDSTPSFTTGEDRDNTSSAATTRVFTTQHIGWEATTAKAAAPVFASFLTASGVTTISPEKFSDFIHWFAREKMGKGEQEINRIKPEILIGSWVGRAFNAQIPHYKWRPFHPCPTRPELTIRPNGTLILEDGTEDLLRGCWFERMIYKYPPIVDPYRSMYITGRNKAQYPKKSLDDIWKEINACLISEDSSMAEYLRLHEASTPAAPGRLKREARIAKDRARAASKTWTGAFSHVAETVKQSAQTAQQSVTSSWDWLNNLGVR